MVIAPLCWLDDCWENTWDDLASMLNINSFSVKTWLSLYYSVVTYRLSLLQCCWCRATTEQPVSRPVWQRWSSHRWPVAAPVSQSTPHCTDLLCHAAWDDISRPTASVQHGPGRVRITGETGMAYLVAEAKMRASQIRNAEVQVVTSMGFVTGFALAEEPTFHIVNSYPKSAKVKSHIINKQASSLFWPLTCCCALLLHKKIVCVTRV